MKTDHKILVEEIDKTLPFSIPENYFNVFAAQIDKQIGYKKVSVRFIRPWMYAAAVFIGIVVVGQVFYISNRQKNLTAENYETYVMAQVDESSVVDYYVNEPSK
ncbi:MAG: hypothetical protein WCG08_07765 [Paludibacter sp.]|jgi:hypothetical protein